jgi:hypothetical protein
MKPFPFPWLRRRWILLLAALTPPCRQITRIASRSCEEPTGPLTRFRLKVHLGICTACRRYLAQLDLLRRAARQSPDHVDTVLRTSSRSRLSAAARERLKARVRCERIR